MPTMQEVRAKYPQYNDMSDDQLAGALHKKFYSDMPFDQFAGKIGLANVPRQTMPAVKGDKPGYAPTWGETGIDAIKSLGAGLGRGAIGLAGLPRDLGELLGRGTTYGIGRLMGETPEEIARQQQAASAAMDAGPFSAPSSAGITRAVEGITGKFYEPETRTGKFAGAIGEFAPAALAGPAGLMRKGAMAVVPAVASEGAGQAVEAAGIPEAAPYARIGGALLGGVAATGGKGSTLKQMREAAPSLPQVRAQKNAIYDALENAGVKYDAIGYQQFADDLIQTFGPNGQKEITRTLTPQTAALLDDMVSKAGSSPTFKQLENMRVKAGQVTRGGPSVTEADKALAGMLKDKLDNFTANSALMSNGSVPAGQVNDMVREARELARRNILGKQLNEMNRKSDWYSEGGERGLRNQVGSFGRSSKGKGLTPVEEDAMKKVIRREGALNVAHTAGSRLGQLAVGAASFAGGGIPGALLGIGGNLAARKGMEIYTKKALDDALKTVLAGRGAQSKARHAAQTSKAKAKLRRLLAVEPALQQGRGALLGEPVVIDAKGNQYYQ